MSNYVFILIEQDPYAVVLDGVVNVDKDYQLLQDGSRRDDFPTKAHFNMLPDYGLQLRDFINNGSDVLVVSDQVRVFMEAQDIAHEFEMLPVTLVNHKGIGVDAPYFIMHLLGFQDAIDVEKTEVRRWASKPENFRSVFDLTLDEARIDPEKTLFRLQHYPYPVIVRRDLAERITEAGLTGISFGEIEDFDHFAIL